MTNSDQLTKNEHGRGSRMSWIEQEPEILINVSYSINDREKCSHVVSLTVVNNNGPLFGWMRNAAW